MKGVSNVMKRALMSAPVRVALSTACSALVAALKTYSYGRLYWNACVVLAVKPMVSPCDHG